MREERRASERFGAFVGAALGAGPSRHTLAAQRARILNDLQATGYRRTLPWLHWAFGAGVAAAVACAVFWFRPAAPAAALSARYEGAPIAERSRIDTRSGQPQSVEFSDGSTVLLGPQTLAEVSRLSQQRADLRLSSGRIEASIRKHTGTQWTIAAGPYAVRVVGTQFSVDWDRKLNSIEVVVEEGRVHVSGGDLPPEGVLLDAGARLQRRFEAAPSTASPVESDPAQSASPTVVNVPAPAPPAITPPRDRSTAGAPSGNAGAADGQDHWLQLANKGNYRKALAAAEKLDFARLVSTLPENQLVMLANAARFSGDAARARQALLQSRQRFAGRPAAQLAALYLARVAEDLEKKPAEATRWLRIFLQESPKGDLAESARTNLMRILLNSGDRAGARAIAEDYLRYHDQGPNAEHARALLAPHR